MTKLRLDHYDPQRVRLPRALLKQIKVRKLGRASGYTAWVVDGGVVRNEVDIDFAIGGNPARYSYVPENEVWLEDTGDEDDMKATFMHEVWEAGSMRAGDSYGRAHGQASAKEKRVRASGALPVFMPNPSAAFHILGFDPAGRQVAHDMQSTRPAAEYAARRLLCDSLLVVRATVHPGTLDVYDPEPIFDHFAPMPTAWSADRSADANYYSFWISPEGDIYPVEPFNHVAVERMLLRYQLVPASEETLRGFSPAIEAGWLQVSARDDDTVTFDFKREPTQRQLDAVFDLVQAHKAKPPVGGYRRRELFCRGALAWLNAPTVTRNPDDTDMGSDWHDGDEETPQQIVDHGHYGLWLSPEGACYVVEDIGGHSGVAFGIYTEVLRLKPEPTVDPEQYLDNHGWLRCKGMPRNFDYLTGERTVLTQAQLDVLFDLSMIMPHVNTRKSITRLIGREIKLRDEGMQKNPAELLTLCSWCQGVIFDGPVGPEGEVSHGMCYACAVKMADEWGLTDEDLEEMLKLQGGAKRNPDLSPGDSVVATWRAWVEAASTPEKAARRKLLVQVINARVLAYRWQSYEKGVENFRFMGATYAEVAKMGTSGVLHEAATICARLGWDAAEIRHQW